MPKTDDWIQTYIGAPFTPAEPHPWHVDINDIAHSLSQLCRYLGHTRRFYSVAQHSVLVYRLCEKLDPVVQMQALLHDAPESYIGDLPRPLMATPLGEQWIIAEQRIWHAVCRHFDLPLVLDAQVKHADNVLLSAERRDIRPDGFYEWPGVDLALADECPIKLVPIEPYQAKIQFLMCFEHICRKRG